MDIDGIGGGIDSLFDCLAHEPRVERGDQGLDLVVAARSSRRNFDRIITARCKWNGQQLRDLRASRDLLEHGSRYLRRDDAVATVCSRHISGIPVCVDCECRCRIPNNAPFLTRARAGSDTERVSGEVRGEIGSTIDQRCCRIRGVRPGRSATGDLAHCLDGPADVENDLQVGIAFRQFEGEARIDPRHEFVHGEDLSVGFPGGSSQDLAMSQNAGVSREPARRIARTRWNSAPPRPCELLPHWRRPYVADDNTESARYIR